MERPFLSISSNGILERSEDGPVILVRPGKNGSLGTAVEVPQELADHFSLSPGDVVAGPTEPLGDSDAHVRERATEDEGSAPPDHANATAGSIPEWIASRVVPTARLVSVDSINGLTPEEALDRPSPREKRNSLERTPPDRWLRLGAEGPDMTGRWLDLAAPLGMGCAGLIYGPHSSGLTRALQVVTRGVVERAADIVPIVLLLRSRGEEMTDWRRRFPTAEVVVCPSGVFGATSDQTLRVADLALECAKRQSELGRHAMLVVDSLSGLWAAMLETEDADAQREADQAYARQRMRVWLQSAGSFGGEGLLGSGLGGSITIVGTVWHQNADVDAEEEGELHPHLRLLEHALHEADWRVPLVGDLAAKRLFPAVDVARAYSRYDRTLLGVELAELRDGAIRAVAARLPLERYSVISAALESHASDEEAWRSLAGEYRPAAGLAALFDPIP